MAGKVDWKQKYFELRSKYLNAIDVGFRLGIEEGKRTAEMENMQMQLQQAQQQAAAAAAAGGGAPMGGGEMPPEEAMAGGGEMSPEEEAAMMGEEIVSPLPEEGGEEGEAEGGGDELDASIDELESYVAKKEKDIDFSKLMKSFHKSQAKTNNKEKSDDKHKKINSILKKWDDEDAESQSTENGNILGQS